MSACQSVGRIFFKCGELHTGTQRVLKRTTGYVCTHPSPLEEIEEFAHFRLYGLLFTLTVSAPERTVSYVPENSRHLA